MKDLKKPNKWNDCVKYFHMMKKRILKESDVYQNGKVTSGKEPRS